MDWQVFWNSFFGAAIAALPGFLAALAAWRKSQQNAEATAAQNVTIAKGAADAAKMKDIVVQVQRQTNGHQQKIETMLSAATDHAAGQNALISDQREVIGQLKEQLAAGQPGPSPAQADAPRRFIDEH